MMRLKRKQKKNNIKNETENLFFNINKYFFFDKWKIPCKTKRKKISVTIQSYISVHS